MPFRHNYYIKAYGTQDYQILFGGGRAGEFFCGGEQRTFRNAADAFAADAGTGRGTGRTAIRAQQQEDDADRRGSLKDFKQGH